MESKLKYQAALSQRVRHIRWPALAVSLGICMGIYFFTSLWLPHAKLVLALLGLCSGLMLGSLDKEDLTAARFRLRTSDSVWLSNLALISLWPWQYVLLLISITGYLFERTEFSISAIINGLPITAEILSGMLNPKMEHLIPAVTVYARQTLEVAVLGSLISFLFALPISMMSAKNIMSEHWIMKLVYHLCRAMMSVLRSLPTFLIGLIFVVIVGLGVFPGVLTITIFSLGIMVKLFSESIEACDGRVIEIVRSSGGNWFNVVRLAILPQVTPMITSQFIYSFEINLHSATVLGLIGAEGIGLPIHEYVNALSFDIAIVYILVVVLMTILVDQASTLCRTRIMESIR